MENTILQIQNVSKIYSTKIAVDNLSLDILGGEILGLLGPNGAGKTTLIRMITRITVPDSGRIFFQGDVLNNSHQQLLGYLPEERGLYPQSKVIDQLHYFLRLKNLHKSDAIKRAEYWLERLGLSQWKNSKVRELSKGMQQKVQLIATIAHEPPLLILDEPFSGLDPVNSQMLEDIIMELKNKGTTVIFSTHRMEQLEELCQSIALINEGRLALSGSVRQLRKQYQTFQYSFEIISETDDIFLPAGVIFLNQKREFDSLNFTVQLNNEISFKELLSVYNERYHIVKVEEKIPTLRDLFFKVVKEPNLYAAASTT